jgi:spore maturation protein CgeB
LRLLLVQPGASFSTADYYNGLKRGLEQCGHEIIPYRLDARIDSMSRWLDSEWRRAGKPDPRPTWADKLYLAGMPMFERALRFVPDWVIVVSAMYVHPDLLVLLKRLGVPTAYVFTESPYDLDKEMKVAPYADVIFTNERTCVADFRTINRASYYLPHAYDPEVHRPDVEIPEDTPAHDVVFVGTGFQERIDLLAAVDWSGIDLGLYGTWSLLGSRSRLRRFVRGEVVPNREATALYRRARVGLNLYRTSVGYGRNVPHIRGAESLNPRAYELAACGVRQVSDERAEVNELFGGGGVDTFRTAAELEKEIREALEYSEDGDTINAMAAVTPHTFAARARQITETLTNVARARVQSRTANGLAAVG